MLAQGEKRRVWLEALHLRSVWLRPAALGAGHVNQRNQRWCTGLEEKASCPLVVQAM
jgi:hypothetical protein